MVGRSLGLRFRKGELRGAAPVSPFPTSAVVTRPASGPATVVGSITSLSRSNDSIRPQTLGGLRPPGEATDGDGDGKGKRGSGPS